MLDHYEDNIEGILLSILFLAKEAADKNLEHTKDGLLVAAQSLLRDFEDHPDLHHNLLCLFLISIKTLDMDKDQIKAFLEQIEKIENSHHLDEVSENQEMKSINDNKKGR